MEQQVIAVMWRGKCVGKLFESFTPRMGTWYQSWHGQVLGREVVAQSQMEVMEKCRKVFRERGLRGLSLMADEGFDVIMPAFEE